MISIYHTRKRHRRIAKFKTVGKALDFATTALKGKNLDNYTLKYTKT